MHGSAFFNFSGACADSFVSCNVMVAYDPCTRYAGTYTFTPAVLPSMPSNQSGLSSMGSIGSSAGSSTELIGAKEAGTKGGDLEMGKAGRRGEGLRVVDIAALEQHHKRCASDASGCTSEVSGSSAGVWEYSITGNIAHPSKFPLVLVQVRECEHTNFGWCTGLVCLCFNTAYKSVLSSLQRDCNLQERIRYEDLLLCEQLYAQGQVPFLIALEDAACLNNWT